ncbi:MAG TPA: SDR family oxidoreductase [Thermoanaerobaculia bacterium]|nr:SDR family oxidoreductase [Thermoanaerobaculia bacterium]
MRREQVVLVTGSSSGIGLATAQEAARRGHRVYASARNPEAAAELLGTPNIRASRLDVTEVGATARAVQEILGKEGRLDALVNNAGYAQYGAIEDVSPEQWRRQYEVTVFGAIEAIRAALPPMRQARHGTIVNISSVGGKVTIPFAAPYCSAKHALESISDSLRVEVAAFGVRVVVVEPGPIETRFEQRALAEVDGILHRTGPYSPFYGGAERAMKGEFAIGRLPAAAVGRVVLDAIEADAPKARYRVTTMAKLLIPLRSLLPDRLFDASLRRTLKLPDRV